MQMAISASNSGGAWDNAKKDIESKKGTIDPAIFSKLKENAVVGDTVGDPLKVTNVLLVVQWVLF